MDKEWLQDPQIYQMNRIEAHSMHNYYANKEEKQSSYIVSLNGYWKFHYAKSLDETIDSFYNKDYDCHLWDDIKVPSHIQLEGYEKPMYVNQTYPWSGSEELMPGDLPAYNPTGSYIYDYELTEDKKDLGIQICFHGVESAFALWVNGQFIGYSEDSFTPATFDITKAMEIGRNRIAVQVYRFCSGSWLEDQDFWRFSGIFRDVELHFIPFVHIQDISIKTTLSKNYKKCTIDIETLLNYHDQDVLMNVFIYDHDGLILNADTLESSCSFILNNPRLWSSECPHLYDCVIEVYYRSQLMEIVKQSFGIREFKIIDGLMCINGQRIVFHGVNRHEFTPKQGRVVSYEDTLNDILIMKENNINAIRTSHYPNQNCLYDLCDQYGLYVIDECNLETHGTWSEFFNMKQVIPDDKPQWLDNMVDRANSMIERDKNHPCILIWSLGNESYGGKNLYKLSQFVRAKDPTRLVHYEGISWDRRYNDTSDIESQMYTPPKEVEAYLKDHQDKPFILCEYAHAMGNSNGALYQYTDLEKKYPLYQGGFIWDFADQALYDGDKLVYGGDFRERPSDYDFCGDGIVFADRKLTPKMSEVRHCYENIGIEITSKTIKITNRYLFTNLLQYTMMIEIYQDGHLINNWVYSLNVEPGKTITIDNPFDYHEDSHEYTLIVSFHDDYEVAFEQYIYPAKQVIVHSEDKISITEDYLNIGVVGKDFHLIFTKTKGLVSYRYHDKELIRVAPRLQFFRASTNNDMENGYGFRYGSWLVASLYASCQFVSIDKSDTKCIIAYDYFLPNKKCVKVFYRIYGDGQIEVTLDYIPDKKEIEMPCFGLMLSLYKEFDQVKYYGYGPDENYCDRCTGSKLGLYNYQVKDNFTPYLYPQECGNRTNVRYAIIHDKQIGLKIESSSFEFSALPYTPLEIENAKHQDELPEIYQSVVCIYQNMMGVGGDNTWGAQTHEEFLLSKKHKVFTFSLKAIEVKD